MCIIQKGWIVACWGSIGSGMETRRAAESGGAHNTAPQ